MALAAACGPSKVIGTERLIADITDDVVNEHGVEAQEVKCPDSVGVDEGSTFRCSVRLAGGTLHYEVTQIDDQGQLSFEPVEAVVNPTLAAARVAEHYVANVGKTVDVDCRQDDLEVRVVPVGGSFVCRATDRGGAVDGVVVTATSADGEFTFEVRAGDASGAG